MIFKMEHCVATTEMLMEAFDESIPMDRIVEQLDEEICLNPVYDYEKGYNNAIHTAIELLEKAGGVE